MFPFSPHIRRSLANPAYVDSGMPDSGEIGMFGLNKTGSLIFINATAQTLLGHVSPDLYQINFFETILSPTDRPVGFPTDMSALLDFTGRSVEGETSSLPVMLQFIRGDGDLFWVQCTFSTITLENASPGVMIHFMALTPGAAELLPSRNFLPNNILSNEETLFRLILDCTPMLIWVVGSEGNARYFNQAWLEYTGRVLEQEMGEGWIQGIHPEDFPICINRFHEAFKLREAFRLEHRLKRFDGQYRWFIEYASPYFSSEGKFMGYIGTSFDIEDRKRAEQALVESEKRFRILVENAPEAIVILDHERGVFMDANQNALDLFGVDRQSILGLGPLDLSPPEQSCGRLSQEIAAEKIAEALQGKAPVFEWIHCNIRGEKFPCEVRLVKMTAGDRVLVRGSIIDISERKKTEQALIDSEARFRRVLDASNEGLWEWNVLTGDYYWNDRMFAIVGLTRQESWDIPTTRSAQQRHSVAENSRPGRQVRPGRRAARRHRRLHRRLRAQPARRYAASDARDELHLVLAAVSALVQRVAARRLRRGRAVARGDPAARLPHGRHAVRAAAARECRAREPRRLVPTHSRGERCRAHREEYRRLVQRRHENEERQRAAGDRACASALHGRAGAHARVAR